MPSARLSGGGGTSPSGCLGAKGGAGSDLGCQRSLWDHLGDELGRRDCWRLVRRLLDPRLGPWAPRGGGGAENVRRVMRMEGVRKMQQSEAWP